MPGEIDYTYSDLPDDEIAADMQAKDKQRQQDKQNKADYWKRARSQRKAWQ